jgi:hypothetical protein
VIFGINKKNVLKGLVKDKEKILNTEIVVEALKVQQNQNIIKRSTGVKGNKENWVGTEQIAHL